MMLTPRSSPFVPKSASRAANWPPNSTFRRRFCACKCCCSSREPSSTRRRTVTLSPAKRTVSSTTTEAGLGRAGAPLCNERAATAAERTCLFRSAAEGPGGASVATELLYLASSASTAWRERSFGGRGCRRWNCRPSASSGAQGGRRAASARASEFISSQILSVTRRLSSFSGSSPEASPRAPLPFFFFLPASAPSLSPPASS
mmetsp:Transcript_45829/g.132716  ORF Transcript_45829/g.132716 Transcript_45829/m.132716 type:complete len:203 (-) Transcript_45829:126-734(-)